MYKAVISEFDKVLIEDDEAINLTTVLEIDKLRQNDKKFIVYTNRSYKDIMFYTKDFIFIDYIISCNGSYIYDVVKEELVYKKDISVSIIKTIKNIINNKIYRYNGIDRCLLNDDFKNINKLDIECSNKKEVIEIEELLNKLNLKINISNYKYKNKYYVEIISKSIDINKSIKILSKYIHIKLKEIVLFTKDNYIDNKIGCIVAMKNSCKDIKNQADIITDSNNNKGVEKTIKELFK